MIKPSLIGQKSRDQQRNTDERDRDLDNHVGARTLTRRPLLHRTCQQNPLDARRRASRACEPELAAFYEVPLKLCAH
jgi:hypothetical protein